MPTPSDRATERARLTIEATLGVPVELWDGGGRQGAHDLRYEVAGKTVAVEVKLIVSAEYRQIEQRASDTPYVRDDRLARSWHATIAHNKRYDAALTALPSLLAVAEGLAWEGGSVARLRRINPGLADLLERLGIQYLGASSPTARHPPGFYLMPDGWSYWVPGVDAVPKFVSDLMSGPKMSTLRRQLNDAETDERHAYFVVGHENAIHVALTADERGLPSEAPVMPPMIDGVWLTASSSVARVLAWLPGRGWIEGSTL